MSRRNLGEPPHPRHDPSDGLVLMEEQPEGLAGLTGVVARTPFREAGLARPTRHLFQGTLYLTVGGAVVPSWYLIWRLHAEYGSRSSPRSSTDPSTDLLSRGWRFDSSRGRVTKMDWEKAKRRESVGPPPPPRQKSKRRCIAKTLSGHRCHGVAQRGQNVCGPHLDQRKKKKH